MTSCRPALRTSVARGLKMEDLELTDAGRRELRDLEGKWKNICVLGGSMLPDQFLLSWAENIS